MKKLILTTLLSAISLAAAADEGMWLLPYIKQMNIATMQKYGCELEAEQIYSENGASLKDAVVIFGGGCTGEVVSDKGLVFTNHHCGYGAIQALSSVEHDFLKYGFWAQNHAEELPAEGLHIRFVRKIVDVTADILGNVPSTAGETERRKIIVENNKLLKGRLAAENPDMEIIVRNFFGGNRYFAFVIEVYRDVRLVGTPPNSIGKFGGDTDNWMWPRHTGDFSVFRIYADKDGRPAEYSPENVPLATPNHLKVSLDGYKKGDFAMIIGFPGSTDRYMTSYEIDRMLEVENPQRIYIRGERQAILKKAMEASDEVRIKYSSKYARSSNYWKNSIGMSRGIEKNGVRAKKVAQEQAFQEWADHNTLPQEGYMTALEDIRKAEEQLRGPEAALQYLQEAMRNSVELLAPARIKAKTTGELREKLAAFYKDYDVELDREVAKRMLAILRENCKDLPDFYAGIVDEKFGGNTDEYVDWLYDNSLFANPKKAQKMTAKNFAKRVEDDAVYPLVKSVDAKIKELQKACAEPKKLYSGAHRRYIAGLMMMQPGRAWASDANFTIRLTYGRILPYSPADGVLYRHYTTLKGVMEKENPANPTDFTVPERLKEIFENKDFGRYADSNGEMRVGFLCDCDITGGNSGSPVLNSRGELIGLAFDGNWEAMSGDVAFEPNLQRTISVDIRYVLMVIEKFGGAKWIIDEL